MKEMDSYQWRHKKKMGGGRERGKYISGWGGELCPPCYISERKIGSIFQTKGVVEWGGSSMFGGCFPPPMPPGLAPPLTLSRTFPAVEQKEERNTTYRTLLNFTYR